jgi:hypothetical protein
METMMNQSESTQNSETICPVCNQEGQCISCNSGNKSEVIFYHPKKILRTICHIATDGSVRKGEVTDEKEVKQDEADAA